MKPGTLRRPLERLVICLARGEMKPLNERKITQTTRHGVTFTADRGDLRGGVRVQVMSGVGEQQIREAFFEFAAWHALEIWPHLNGFTGYGSVAFVTDN